MYTLNSKYYVINKDGDKEVCIGETLSEVPSLLHEDLKQECADNLLQFMKDSGSMRTTDFKFNMYITSAGSRDNVHCIIVKARDFQ
jgi:hypothetical protein